MIGNEVGDKTLINNIVLKHILNFGQDFTLSNKPANAVISYQWDPAINAEDFNSTIRAIIKGELMAIDSIGVKKYGKPVCELNPSQIKEVLSEMGFNLEFSYRELREHLKP